MSTSRRDFLKITGAAAVAGAVVARSSDDASAEAQTAYGAQFAAAPIETVRIGFVGIGLQGGGHVQNFLKIPGCRITAVCDIREERTKWATDQIVKAGHPPPVSYTRGPRDFDRLCETEELDLVFTATPWEWHVPVMLAAMKTGKHAATEVPAAMTLEDCWAMVEAAEKHRKHCLMMENCNYDWPAMMAFHMVRQGLFGELLHAEGGYLHDLRGIKFENRNEGLWRRAWSQKLNGNPYPTHGLGPVANCLDINRGDRFDYMVSMSSSSRGLQEWAIDHFPEGAPQRQEKFVQGDVNTSLIKTARGRTIMVQHCTNLPRPYSRINIVQGTKGLFSGYPHRLYIEGRGRNDQWVDAATLRSEFEHPLWKEIAAQAEGAGHGGMDFIEDYRLIKCLREGLPLDMTVYDAAALSAVVDLSVRSVAKSGQPVAVPGTSRGGAGNRPRRFRSSTCEAMAVPTSRIAAELERVGMPAGDLEGRVRLVESAALEFFRTTGRRPEWAWWVPGRIELFGKHTDYAGGRSLVAAVPRGFAVVAGRRDDDVISARDAHWQADMQCSLLDDGAVFKGWTNYVAVVSRRLARNFPGTRLGTDIVFASDLPRAAGISSSSALVVGVALALARRGALRDREEWQAAIRSKLDLAGYLGAVENGLTFGALAGTAGVGTHGGSEDHTAILNAQPESFSAFSYVPVRPLGDARLPDAWRFAVMSSGVEASKAGEALDSYNRASLATRALTDVWARHSGQSVQTLAAALASASVPEFERAIASAPHPDFSAGDLSARLAHFVSEDARVPRALAAIAEADVAGLRALSNGTQHDADALLRNQIPETNVLAALAHDAGAFAASSFGAGFGGSVWAMIHADDAAAVVERWQAAYLEKHAPPKPVTAFIARPAPSASELFLSE